MTRREPGAARTRRPLAIVAGPTGQHARVVFEAAKLEGWTIAGLVGLGEGDAPDVFGAPLLGGEDRLSDPGFLAEFALAPGTGDNRSRLRVAGLLGEGKGRLAVVVHPAAVVSPSAALGPGCVILAGAVVGTGARLGPACIVNHGASVGHDGVLGAAVNLCSGARLAGCVSAGEGVFIGLNASVIQGVSLGAWCTVGAGAAVLRDVPAGATAVGVPARLIEAAAKR